MPNFMQIQGSNPERNQKDRNMSGFTASDALEFQGTEDAEMITWKCVQRICVEHGADCIDFLNDECHNELPDMTDAGDLLAWLGY
jgi:hypothetical protein